MSSRSRDVIFAGRSPQQRFGQPLIASAPGICLRGALIVAAALSVLLPGRQKNLRS
jgi:hypothetical protein